MSAICPCGRASEIMDRLKIQLRAIVALFMSIFLHSGNSIAAPVTYHSAKDFRELIVRGERPEIASCMVAALADVRKSEKFAALRWTDDDSDAAVMNESEINGHLLRQVHFHAEARERNAGFIFESWGKVDIACEQHDEGAAEVHIMPVSN